MRDSLDKEMDMWHQQSRPVDSGAARGTLFSSAEPDSRKEQELRDRVRRHQIHWQTWPEYHVCGVERRQVGFRLGVLGTHDRPSARPIAGCPESWKVYTSLHELVRWVLPDQKEAREVRIDVDATSLVRQGDRRELMVTIRIAPEREISQPLDASQVSCLAAIEARLLRLGARRDPADS